MKNFNPDKHLAAPCPTGAPRAPGTSPPLRAALLHGRPKPAQRQAGGASGPISHIGPMKEPPAAFSRLPCHLPCRPRAKPAWCVLATRKTALARTCQLPNP